METIYVSKFELEGERWKITGTEKGISGIYPVAEDFSVRENEITRKAARQLQEYFFHGRTSFSIPLDLHGTPFRTRVWEALRSIPYGETVSYSRIAAEIGNPKAVRAVGQAIGKNPCLIVVPCHRVVGKDGSLTGFSAGMDLKKRLLALEGR